MHESSVDNKKNKWGFLVNLLARHLTHNMMQSISYRIIGLPTTENPNLKIQIVGKNISFPLTAQQIMRDDMLMHFSKADVAIIAHLGTQSEMKQESIADKPNISSTIIRQNFLKNESEFVVKHNDVQEITQQSAEALFFDVETKRRFNTEDALMIGYAAAEARYKKLMAETRSTPTYRLLCVMDMSVEYQQLDSGRIISECLGTIFSNHKLFESFNATDRGIIAYEAAKCRYQKMTDEVYKKPTWCLCGTQEKADHIIFFQELSTGKKQQGTADIVFYDTKLFGQFGSLDFG